MLARSYYRNTISEFLSEPIEYILGIISRSHNFAIDVLQRNSWIDQISHAKDQLNEYQYGEICFEYSVPRMGKRIDILLLIEGIIFVLEYKVGAKNHERYGIDQVLDYALDLKNFHEGSHERYVVPILVATNAPIYTNKIYWYKDRVAKPLLASSSNLGELIGSCISTIYQDAETVQGFSEGKQEPLDNWFDGGYRPTPTIVEAAQALYQGHAVKEISRSDSGVWNLTNTADAIREIIKYSKSEYRKSICFVTGVPGAGKTLAGLNIATQKVTDPNENAVFLSGNGPLVVVLREALARDDVERSKINGVPKNKKIALQEVSAFIQNIHHFRDDGLRSDNPPTEHVVVFDEAQRAWNRGHAERFMAQKRGVSDFNMSEPEFLISLMDRRKDWCTIVCLIGGGQEINIGEAGLVEWFDALQARFSHWDVYHSDRLADKEYSWGQDLRAKLSDLNATENRKLHLSVSIRSFRAEKLSAFVGAIVEGDASRAREIHPMLTNYPFVLTRNIATAREWLRRNARGTERLGLVASSGAMRLKPEGIHVKAGIDPANWFLNGKEDVRSSYCLEDVATEFDIQGLELDWTGVCWDADLRMGSNGWSFYAFRGTKWQKINNRDRQIYLVNAYRVLLTRARQGMVIFVPNGSCEDDSRVPEFYDKTFDFLKACGLVEL